MRKAEPAAGQGRVEGPPSQAGHVQRFHALLERGDRNLGWTIARVPFDPGETWQEMVRLRIAGEINQVRFRSSLFPAESGGFYILVNRAMQKDAGAVAGHQADFAVWPDLEPRPAELPDELAVLLDEEAGLRAWYDQLGEYTRREIGKWVQGVKSAEAQARRAMQTAERLLATMEAEEELPPLIANAFRRRPKAKAGWDCMTLARRRQLLMAVFYYQSPEAREKRLAKVCDEAEKLGER